MDDEFMDEPWGEFGEEEQVEEGPNSPPWEVEFDEEPMMGRQEEYENEQEPSDEWLEIVETEEGLDTEPREAPLPYDDLEEPSWEHEEEDQKRVDDAKKIVDEHLNPPKQNEGQWSPPDLQAAKKKKKKEDDEKDKKINAKPDPSTINVPPAPASSAPPPPEAQSQQKLPDEQKQPPPPPPAKPSQKQPAPASVQTALSTATGSTSMPTVSAVRQPHADQPGAPIALPIASRVPTLDMSSNNPASGYSQDLGGLGQIGVFSSDGGLSHSNHRMDSFAVLLTFIFVVLYTRTS